MFFDLLRSHIPRTWKAAAALLLSISGLSIGLNALTSIVIGHANAESWFKMVAGLIIGVSASLFFYLEQSKAGTVKSKIQIEAETIGRAGESMPHSTATAWHMNDDVEQKNKN